MSQQGRFEAFYNDWGGGTTVTGWVIGLAGLDIGDVVLTAHLFNLPIGTMTVPALKANARERFSITSSERIQPTDIVSGRLKLHARGASGYEIEVRPADSLLTWMARVAFSQNVFGFLRDETSVKFILERIEGKFGPEILTGRRLETPTEPIVDINHDLTTVLVRAGTISADRSAIMAGGGNLLLYEGSNGLIKQYQESALTPRATVLAEEWQGVISRRVAHFRKIDVPFIQIIIPEKSSAIAHHYPLPVITPTRLLDAVEAWAKSEAAQLGTCFVSVLDSFRSDPDLESLFLKTDSHFAARGAIATVKIILNALASQNGQIAQVMPAVTRMLKQATHPSTNRRILTGDLAVRFFGVPLYEEDFDVSYGTLFGKKSGVKQTRHVLPPSGNLNGTRIAWHHPHAPIKLRAVAFGNSFFERGANCTQLSWWFKHLFEEFHMAWSKDIDLDYIESIKPDVVMAQTIERFLPTVATV